MIRGYPIERNATLFADLVRLAFGQLKIPPQIPVTMILKYNLK